MVLEKINLIDFNLNALIDFERMNEWINEWMTYLQHDLKNEWKINILTAKPNHPALKINCLIKTRHVLHNSDTS